VSVPEIAMFQPALAPVSLDALPIEPGKGWIVEVVSVLLPAAPRG